ncbi:MULTISPECIES: NUMOD4 motif-containing HNH endonuclease [unclassified Rhodococcus (in: high G+C Gram-positive bacteria)]|uniref:NUMOD4 motif-containing HNH endonuclease n=1 Tax=unclassified Rhodococcus (in: high G+C Gram-positive bacteria) TaxID=192944 RepID=UPI000933534C|nr:hypothetical protein BKE56_015735 [Rhodococcus sp. M8]
MPDPTPEIWKPIPGYEGYYEVSDQGRVRSLSRTITDSLGRQRKTRPLIMAPGLKGSGHLSVRLVVERKGKNFHVHTLVMLAFTGPRPEGMEVCHGPGGKLDNRLCNLRYDTRTANLYDAVRDGTHFQSRKTHCPRGHDYAIHAVRIPSRPTARYCGICIVDSARRAREKAKAESIQNPSC